MVGKVAHSQRSEVKCRERMQPHGSHLHVKKTVQPPNERHLLPTAQQLLFIQSSARAVGALAFLGIGSYMLISQLPSSLDALRRGIVRQHLQVTFGMGQ